MIYFGTQRNRFILFLLFFTFFCSSVHAQTVAQSVPVNTNSGGIWLDFDLEAEQTIDSVSIAWSQGNQKSVDFNLQMSLDNKRWKTVYSGVSSSSKLEQYNLSSTQARFMRIQINDLTQNYKTLISDLRLNEHLNITPAVQESTVSPVTRNSNQLPIRNIENMIEIGFEQSDFVSNGLRNSGNEPQIVSNQVPVFEGKRSLRVLLDKQNSAVPFRTAFHLNASKYGKKFTEFEYGKDYWIGFAIYLDDSYQMPEYSDTVFQLNSRPDKHLGDGNRAANITLMVTGNKENRKHGVNEPHWAISVNGDDRRVFPKAGLTYRTSEFDTLSAAKGDTGRWVSWVIHFKHTYNSDGFMDIWKDGLQVYSKNGIHTSYNDNRGPYVRMGSSKWSWKTDKYVTIKPAKRLSYLDAVRMAQGADRYNDVAPVSTDANIVINKSAVVAKQPATPKPVAPKQPVVTPKPVVPKQPVATPKPVVAKQPVVTPKPVVAKQPSSSSRNTRNLLEFGFELPNLTSYGLASSGNTAKVAGKNAPVFEGKQSLSILIDKNKSPVSYRTEFVIGQAKHERKWTDLENGKEYWYGFAVYLEDWKTPKLSDIIFQIHSRPDKGEVYRNPAITLSISGELENGRSGVSESHWSIGVRGDSRKLFSDKNYQSQHGATLSPVKGDTGRWVRWVIHTKNTYNSDGFLEVWKDGVKVYNKRGIRTAFNDDRGGYMKIGSYKWSWKPKHSYPTINPARRQSYLDSLRVAIGPNRYNDVAP